MSENAVLMAHVNYTVGEFTKNELPYMIVLFICMHSIVFISFTARIYANPTQSDGKK